MPAHAQQTGPAKPSAAAPPDTAPRAVRREVVLWTFTASDLPENTLSAVQHGLNTSLQAENGRHLVGEKPFRTYVAAQSPSVPDCLEGLGGCPTVRRLAFDVLGLTSVIRVDITKRSDRLWAHYRRVDRRGDIAGQADVSGADARELALSLAGAIFDATASVTLKSTPPKAVVTVDGEPVGKTPMTHRLAVGAHQYTMKLVDHSRVEGSFEVTGQAGAVVERTLEPTTGTLVVDKAPQGAQLFVDGARRGAVDQQISVDPGRHDIEVRAAGFDNDRQTVTVAAGQTVTASVDMPLDRALLGDIGPKMIAANRYIGRISYDHSFHKTTFRGARGHNGGADFEFLAFSDGGDLSRADRDLRQLTDPNGVRLGLTYSWRNFGLVLLSASYTSTSLDQKAWIGSSAADSPLEATLTEMSQVQLRPLQVRYRRFYKRLAPFVELGTGINIQWVEADGELLERPVTLSNSEAFWTLGLGGSYYVTPHVFGMVRYSAQFYIDDGLGAEHVVSIGAGVALPNLFGFEPEPPDTL